MHVEVLEGGHSAPRSAMAADGGSRRMLATTASYSGKGSVQGNISVAHRLRSSSGSVGSPAPSRRAA